MDTKVYNKINLFTIKYNKPKLFCFYYTSKSSLL